MLTIAAWPKGVYHGRSNRWLERLPNLPYVRVGESLPDRWTPANAAGATAEASPAGAHADGLRFSASRSCACAK